MIRVDRYEKEQNPDIEAWAQTYSESTDIWDPFLLSEVQTYNPVYDVLFPDQDNKGIGLNHEYRVKDLKTVYKTRLLAAGFRDEILKADIHIKYAPLLDPIKYMIGKYDRMTDEEKQLPQGVSSNSKDNHSNSKLNSPNNYSYVDNFFCFLSSKLLHDYGFPHGIDYYGSFLAKQQLFRYNATDDLHYLIESDVFHKKVKQGSIVFHEYAKWMGNKGHSSTNAFRGRLEFDENADADASLLDIETFDQDLSLSETQIETSDPILPCKDSTNDLELVYQEDDDSENESLHLQDDRSNDSMVSLTDDEEEEPINLKKKRPIIPKLNLDLLEPLSSNQETIGIKRSMDQDNDPNLDHNQEFEFEFNQDSDHDDESVWEDIQSSSSDDSESLDIQMKHDTCKEMNEHGSQGDSQDESNDSDEHSSNEEETMIYIKDYPVQAICLEKCHGTLDELFDNGMMNESMSMAYMFQVIMTLLTYQMVFGMTHNDLHTNNIMYINTEIDYLYYKFGGKRYRVPTYGRIMKIIDFGRSIYSYDGHLFTSDSFSSEGDAFSQYNVEPYYNPRKPRVEPSYSFDLCRLGTSLYDFVFDHEEDKDMDPETFDSFQRMVLEWCLDDEGRNVLYKKTGEERYPEFKLYKMIARTVSKHLPENQLRHFKDYEYPEPVVDQVHKQVQDPVLKEGDIITGDLLKGDGHLPWIDIDRIPRMI